MRGYFGFILSLIILFFFANCDQDKKDPVVTTGEILDLTPTTISIHGSVNKMIGNLRYYGHCYSKKINPTLNDTRSRLSVLAKSGPFESTLTGLEEQTTYHIRAYAEFEDTVCFGEDLVFYTEAKTEPEVVTGVANTEDQANVTIEGIIEDLGHGVNRVKDHGHVWSQFPNPDTSDSKVSLGETMRTGAFTSILHSLEAATDYYINAFAINEVGIGYGEEVTFTTAGVPQLSNEEIYFTGIHLVHCSAEVVDDGGISETERGFCFSTSTGPTIEEDNSINGGTGTGIFNISLEGLIENTTYYIRAYAKNEFITIYGEEFVTRTHLFPEMVRIPGGSFNMGNNTPGEDFYPEHQVFLSSFELSIFEITNLQFASFINEIGVSKDGGGLLFLDAEYVIFEHNGYCFRPVKGSENYPVVNVTWRGVDQFCKWAGGNLPSEAQWEYAAREGGISNTEYSGSNNPLEVAIFWNNAEKTPFPVDQGRGPNKVGQKKRNALGLYDMSGNVWEWCSDWYGAYSNLEQSDPEGPGYTASKVGRGGSWRTGTEALKVYYRGRSKPEEWPDWHNSSLGFRLAK